MPDDILEKTIKIISIKVQTSGIIPLSLRRKRIADEIKNSIAVPIKSEPLVPKGFWNGNAAKKSKIMPSCTMNDCAEVQIADREFTQSWFTAKKFLIDKTSPKNGKKQPTNKQWLRSKKIKETKDQVSSRKIRVHPTEEQRKILEKWFHTARWTYNKTVEAIATGTKIAKQTLRNACVNKIALVNEKWVTETPYDIRDEAMISVINAYKSNFAKKTGRPFTIKYKTRKASSDSIVIHKKHWRDGNIFYERTWGSAKLKSTEKLPTNLPCDSRLLRTRLGQYYICMPRPTSAQAINANANEVIALDPGIRTFCAGYDPSGSVWEFGKGDIGRIARLCSWIDKLQSKRTAPEVRHKQRYSYTRALLRMYDRIHNLVDELHKKLSLWLCRNYRTILLPSFETQQMVSSIDRKISNKSARMMMTMSHFRFRQRLINKAREYPGCSVIICNEAYTSKTCGECGVMHETLGGNKEFRCKSCGQRSDRDFNAARNILLRYLVTKKNGTTSVPHVESSLLA